MNNRRLYSPGPTLKGPVTFSKLPVRICIISAFVLMLCLMLFIRFTGGAILYVNFWVYVAAVGAITLLLLGAGCLGIWHRVKSEQARMATAVGLGSVMIVLALVLAIFCVSLSENVQKPIGYYDSPEGNNKLVVMRTIAEEGAIYTAYPAVNEHFFFAALDSGTVQSSTGIAGVEWPQENLAQVQFKDLDGNPAVLTVDFSLFYEGEEPAGAAE